MNQAIKNKRKARTGMHREEEEHKETSMHSGSMTHQGASGSRRGQDNKMGLEQEWDYQRVKEVVNAVYVLASLFLNNEQKARIDKINKDVSSILGVKSLSEWEPPQPLLNIIGLNAGQSKGYSHAA